MPQQRRGDPFIEQHGVGAGRGFAGTNAGRGAFARCSADVFRAAQIGLEDAAVTVVVPFHFRAFACNGDTGQPAPGARIAPGKAVGCGQKHLVVAVAGRGRLYLRHAVDCARGCFGPGRVLLYLCRGRFGGRIGQFQCFEVPVPRKVPGIGQTRIGILGRFACHRHGPHRHLFDSAVGDVRGGNNCDALAHEGPQPDIGGLCTLGLFKLSVAHIDGE